MQGGAIDLLHRGSMEEQIKRILDYARQVGQEATATCSSSYTADATLSSGYHRLRVEYLDDSGSAAVQLGWNRSTD